MGEIDFDRKFVAIKMHFGEPGNLAFLRPNWAKTVADFVKELGGKPFLTDCNTLYVGGRKNALDHLDAAYLNGFIPFSTGCHVIIADGLKGTDEALVPVDGRRVCEGGQDRPGRDGRRRVHLPDPLQGPRGCGLRRGAEEHRHGLRLPGRQDGACTTPESPMWTRSTAWAAACCTRICAHGALVRHGPEGHHRPQTSAWAAAAASASVPTDAIQVRG